MWRRNEVTSWISQLFCSAFSGVRYRETGSAIPIQAEGLIGISPVVCSRSSSFGERITTGKRIIAEVSLFDSKL
jgi:hypothetical protein